MNIGKWLSPLALALLLGACATSSHHDKAVAVIETAGYDDNYETLLGQTMDELPNEYRYSSLTQTQLKNVIRKHLPLTKVKQIAADYYADNLSEQEMDLLVSINASQEPLKMAAMFRSSAEGRALAAKMNDLQHGQGRDAKERMAGVMTAIERELDTLTDG